jgi:hypothetical protein
MSQVLPPAFMMLADLVPDWAIDSESGRMRRRFETPFPVLNEFYARMMPQIEPALSYLATKPMIGLSDADRNLLLLTLSLAEVSIAVEKVKSTRNADTYDVARLEFVHEQ